MLTLKSRCDPTFASSRLCVNTGLNHFRSVFTQSRCDAEKIGYFLARKSLDTRDDPNNNTCAQRISADLSLGITVLFL